MRNNKHHSKYLQNAYNKYGAHNFIYEILLYCPRTELLMLEQYLMDYYQPEYNILPSAGRPLGNKLSEETKRKISIKNKGFKHSEESKKKISEVQTGKKRTSKALASIRDYWKNNPKPTRKVLKIDINTLFVLEEFESAKAAAEKSDVSYSFMRQILNGTKQSKPTFFWKYKENCNNVEHCIELINKHETI